MTMPSDLTDLKEGDVIDPRQIEDLKVHPEAIDRYSNPPYGNKKGQKKILCIALSATKGVMPTLVSKPIKKKYGSRWFSANEGRYFINYKALIDIGKHYLYMTTEDNAVGACYLVEHMEFADSNQVELMANQHAVEVFKKHKGIPLKMLLIVAVIAMVAVIALLITVQFVIGLNNQITKQQTTITSLQTTNNALHCQYEGTACPIETKVSNK